MGLDDRNSGGGSFDDCSVTWNVSRRCSVWAAGRFVSNIGGLSGLMEKAVFLRYTPSALIPGLHTTFHEVNWDDTIDESLFTAECDWHWRSSMSLIHSATIFYVDTTNAQPMQPMQPLQLLTLAPKPTYNLEPTPACLLITAHKPQQVH